MRGALWNLQILIGVTLIALDCLLFLPASAQQPVGAAIPIVDVHTHFVGPARIWEHQEVVKAALKLMDRYGIRKSIIMPPPQIDVRLISDYTNIGAALHGYTDRFSFLGGGGTLNPMLHRFANPSLVNNSMRRQFAAMAGRIIDAGAVGFGEMASLHISVMRGHPYEFVPADHPLMRVLADVAAARNVPIDLHMDAVSNTIAPPVRFAGGDNPPRLPETLAAFKRLLLHNPKTEIVWAHGGSDPLGAMTPAMINRLMEQHANLFVSLRMVGARAPLYNKMLTAKGLDRDWRNLLQRHPSRFMIGTDSFFIAKSDGAGGPGYFFARRTLHKLRATRHVLSLLPADIAVKIANDNATRIYRLRTK